MSIQAINWAIDFEASNSSEKSILLVLANYVGGDGRCYPGQQNIGKQACCSERTVREVLRSLEERGIIRREQRRRKDGSRTSDIIVLVQFDQPANSAGSGEANRQISPNQPANSAGPTTFEPPVEPPAAARERSDLESLTDKLIEAAGEGNIHPHGALVVGPILGLLDAGCDLETDILPTIRARCARLKRPAGSWAYFVEPIREAHAQRIEAGRGVTKPPTPEAPDKRWQTRLTLARQKRQWSTAEWGPAPGQTGSIVPKHLLQPGDGEGWREWQSEAA